MNGDRVIVHQMCRQMLEDIYDRVLFSNLTPWEVEFLDDIRIAIHLDDKQLSQAQINALRRLHVKVSPQTADGLIDEAHIMTEDQR